MVRSGGRPPWERGAAGVGGDAETGGSDVGGENRVLANGALGEFIDMCIPVGGRRVFTRLGVALWTIMWFVLFLAQVGLQARYAFFERDSARGGVWFLQMAGISLSSDWWPVAVFFDVGVVPGLLLWLAAHVMRKPWIAVAGDVLIVQCVAGAVGAEIGKTVMYAMYGPHVESLIDSTTGRPDRLYYDSSPAVVVPGLVVAGVAVVVAVVLVVLRGVGVSPRVRVGGNVVAGLGLMGMLWVGPADANQLFWVNSVMAVGMVLFWIPGELRAIRRCVLEGRDASWQPVAAGFLVLDFVMLMLLAYAAATGV